MKRKLTVILALAVIAAMLSAGAVGAAPDKTGGKVHVVQWGENLAGIAYKYGTTVDALIQANHLPNADIIYIGQQLVIPSLAGQPQAMPLPAGLTDGLKITVNIGETLAGIAAKYGTTVQALMQANGLQSGYLLAGQQLIVPGKKAPKKAAAPKVQPRTQPGAGLSTYVVQPGDSLSAIAFKYGTTVNDIMQANGLYSPWIQPGQRLMVPGGMVQPERPAGTYYTVQPGDTLAGIALLYGTTVPAILQANGLSLSQWIVPGQELVIPGMNRPYGPSSMMMGDQWPGQGQMFPGQMPGQWPGQGQTPDPWLGQGRMPGQGQLNGQMPEGWQHAGPSGMPQQSWGYPQTNRPTGATKPKSGGTSIQTEGLTFVPALPPQQGNPVGPQGGVFQGYGLPQPQGLPSNGALGQPQLPGAVPQSYGPTQGSIDPTGYAIGEMAPGAFPLSGPSLVGDPMKPPLVTMKWQGRVLSQTQPEGNRYPGVIRVNAGAKGMQVTLAAKGANWSTTGITGHKPELGEGIVEFAPVSPGVYIISLDGQDASLRVNIKPNSLTWVEFAQVPANQGP